MTMNPNAEEEAEARGRDGRSGPAVAVVARLSDDPTDPSFPGIAAPIVADGPAADADPVRAWTFRFLTCGRDRNVVRSS